MNRENELARKRSRLSQEQWAILEKRLQGKPSPLLAQKQGQEKMAPTKTLLHTMKPQSQLDLHWPDLVEACRQLGEQLPTDLSLQDHLAFNQHLDRLCLIS